MTKKYRWSELQGMSEERAEGYMLKHWKRIPQEWYDPLFRDQVTGVNGQAEIDAHMNFGELAYGSDKKLGADARGVWERRNVAGQGHPAEEDFKKAQRKPGGEKE